MGTLDGQVAIVTGGRRGIGLAVANALSDEGAAVAIVARSYQELEHAAKQIGANGGRALAIPADVTDSMQVHKSVAATERELGPVTLLVNNAGTPGPVGADWEVDADEWWRCIEVSVRGAFLYSQAVLPQMVERSCGRIINIASGTGIRAVPGLTGTSVAKTALIRFSEGLAEETRNLGINVFAIYSGPVRTQLVKSYLQTPELRRWMPQLLEMTDAAWNPPELTGQLCVRIASGNCDRLSGCFFTVADDIDGLISRSDVIQDNELHKLRLRT